MICDLKPYPAMKDSGVPWLGEVPEHWEVRRTRNAVDMRVSNIDKHTKEGELPVRLCNYIDVYKHDKITEHMSFMCATAMAEEIEHFRLEPGDVPITKDSEAWNDIGIPALVEYTAEDLVCGYHLALLRPRKTLLSGAYLFRLLQSPTSSYQFHVEANGVTRYGLSHNAIKSIVLPLPTLSEQAAIVRFLDYIDRRIRRYIRAKQKLIKLLEEQKQAIIHRAVTRGLDPNVRLKPSGVEWLGDVPEYWEVTKLKRVSLIQGGYAFPADSFGDAGIPVVRMNNIRRGTLDFDQVVRIPEHQCKEAFTLKEGDIAYGLSGSIGATGSLGNYAVVKSGNLPAQLNQRVARFQPNKDRIAGGFLLESLQTNEFYEQVLAHTTGTAQFNVSTNDIGNVALALPPLDEQKQIVNHLKSATESIVTAVDRARQEIVLFREYRTRLIADAVTGKIDVREAAAWLHDEAEEPELVDEGDAMSAVNDEPVDDIDNVPEEVEA